MTVKKKKKVVKKTTQNKKKEVANPIGRPTTYKPEYCQVVIDFMDKGYSKEATAGHLSISKYTLYEWIKKYPDFANAVHIGETKSQVTWEKKAVDHAVHTKDGKRLDSRIYALQMKNRFGWSDKKEVINHESTEKKKTFGFSLDEEPSYGDE